MDESREYADTANRDRGDQIAHDELENGTKEQSIARSSRLKEKRKTTCSVGKKG